MTHELYKLWSYLHKHPEASWEEHETTTYLLNYFLNEGLKPVSF